MKKSLLALAAIGAFSGAAQAQSSVTVYGIIDVGYLATRGTEGRASTAASATAAAYANGGNLNTSAFNASNLSTSRLGFRGVEDMGGGLRASFVAEIGLTPNSNGFSGSSNASSTAMGATYVNNSAVLDNRQTFAGLAKKGIGEVRLGRQYTPVHEAVGATNLGGANNMVGDVVYTGGNSTATKTLSAQINDNYQIRAANAITVRTENISGFQAAALYSVNIRNNDNPGTATSTSQGATDYRMGGLVASFTGVPKLSINAAWQQTDLHRQNDLFINTAFTGGTATVLGSTLTAITPAAQGATTNRQVDYYGNVSYDFGPVKVALQTIGLKVTQFGNDLTKRTANQVQVSAPVTSTINVWGTVGAGKRSTWAASTATAAGAFERERNFSAFQLGGTYSLSKRSALYAIYGQAAQDANTAGQTGFKDQQYAVGMRHTF